MPCKLMLIRYNIMQTDQLPKFHLFVPKPDLNSSLNCFKTAAELGKRKYFYQVVSCCCTLSKLLTKLYIYTKETKK